MVAHSIRTAALLALLLAAPGCAASAVGPSRPHPSGTPAVHVDVSIFYESLAPHGEWFVYGGYGYAWTPYDVPYGWRPYTHGHWIFTEYGWTWVSHWKWGWAPFHYGRWIFDPGYGWIWIPDRIWGPAWVAWRWSDDWVGWAPLPPDAGWHVGIGLRFGDSRPRWEHDAHCWSFTRPHWLTHGQVRYKLEPAGRNVSLFERTRVIADFDEVAGHPRNRGRDVGEVERLTRRAIPRVRVADVRTPAEGERVQRGEARLYRPEVAPAPDRRPPLKPPAAPAPSAETQRVRREQEAGRVERHYREEQQRLEQLQRVEKQKAAEEAETVRRRHEQEQRELERQKEQERKAREQRIEKRIEKPAAKPPPAKRAEPPAAGAREKRKG